MSPFNLDDYEPVEDRLRAFWKDHPMGRIATELVTQPNAEFYIVKASIWRGFEVKGERGETPPPGGTGYAGETTTQRGVNATSALENCETSAIGRALANLGYAAKSKRPSREEMASASSSPAPVTAPTEPQPSGGDGDAERGGDVKAREADVAATQGEVAASSPPPTKSDAQRWMEEFHPGKPHKMRQSEKVPTIKFCVQDTLGDAACPYAVDKEGVSA